MNLHDRRAQADACDFSLKRALVLTCKVRHVSRRATHVKANHLVETRKLRYSCRTHNTARRAGKDRVLALKLVCVREPAGALHELQAYIAER